MDPWVDLKTALSQWAPELIKEIEAGLLELEAGQAPSEAAARVLMAVQAFRRGVLLRGLASGARLGVEMELVCRLMSQERVEPSQPLVDALFQAADVATALLSRPDESQAIDTEGPQRAMAAALQAVVDASRAAQWRRPLGPESDSGLPPWRVPQFLLRSYAQANHIFFIEPPPQDQSRDFGPCPARHRTHPL